MGGWDGVTMFGMEWAVFEVVYKKRNPLARRYVWDKMVNKRFGFVSGIFYSVFFCAS